TAAQVRRPGGEFRPRRDAPDGPGLRVGAEDQPAYHHVFDLRVRTDRTALEPAGLRLPGRRVRRSVGYYGRRTRRLADPGRGRDRRLSDRHDRDGWNRMRVVLSDADRRRSTSRG